MMEDKSKALLILERYEAGEPWFTPLAEYKTSILESLAKTCYDKMLTFWGWGVEGGITQLDDAYPHLIIAHAFMEFTYMTGLKQFAGRNDEGEKKGYAEFCRVNCVPKQLVEKGWQEYLED